MIELKVWRDKNSIEELVKQITKVHVTGQEHLIIAQVVSRNQDVRRVVERVLHLLSSDQRLSDEFTRFAYPGSFEQMFEGSVRVKGRSIPLMVSFIDLAMIG